MSHIWVFCAVLSAHIWVCSAVYSAQASHMSIMCSAHCSHLNILWSAQCSQMSILYSDQCLHMSIWYLQVSVLTYEYFVQCSVLTYEYFVRCSVHTSSMFILFSAPCLPNRKALSFFFSFFFKGWSMVMLYADTVLYSAAHRENYLHSYTYTVLSHPQHPPLPRLPWWYMHIAKYHNIAFSDLTSALLSAFSLTSGYHMQIRYSLDILKYKTFLQYKHHILHAMFMVFTRTTVHVILTLLSCEMIWTQAVRARLIYS